MIVFWSVDVNYLIFAEWVIDIEEAVLVAFGGELRLVFLYSFICSVWGLLGEMLSFPCSKPGIDESGTMILIERTEQNGD